MTYQDLLTFSPSPIQRLDAPKWAKRGVELWVKRDDLLAPVPDDPFCGNKWRKLQHNLLAAKAARHTRVVSFGGAYSNHIAALASAGKHLGIETIGIIRGEEVDNPTLSRAKADGMQLHFVDRTTYRCKNEAQEVARWTQQFAPCYLIPEGGTNARALLGCQQLAKEVVAQLDQPPTHIAVACGTGGTLAGIIQGLPTSTRAIGVSVLKGNFMRKEVTSFLGGTYPNWDVYEQFHHGGYAKRSAELMAFIQAFRAQHGIQLEPIYTGKLFFALEELLRQGVFPSGSRVVGIHTGGLQGFNLP